jgi:hypothetical protein
VAHFLIAAISIGFRIAGRKKAGTWPALENLSLENLG